MSSSPRGMRFKAIVRSTRLGFIVNPVLPGDDDGAGVRVSARVTALLSASGNARPPIDGSHPRVCFVGIADGKLHAASTTGMVWKASASKEDGHAMRPSRPFYGPLNSGVHRSTEWLRPEGMRRTATR